MKTGTCIHFSGPRGYGFLSDDDGGPDIFCHFSSIVGMDGYKKLEKGQRVSYSIETGPKNKPQAAQVRILEGEV